MPCVYSGQNVRMFPLEYMHDIGVCQEQMCQAN